jgi:hypothetical protein
MKYYCLEPGVCVLPTMQEPRGGHLGELVKYLKHIDSLEKFDTSCDRAGWFEALTQFQECQNGKWVNVQIRDTVNAYRWFIVPQSEEKDGPVGQKDEPKGIRTEKQSDHSIKFFWENGVYLGFAYPEVCGYYHFVFEESRGGCWASYALRVIADKVDELNKEWDEKVCKDLAPKVEPQPAPKTYTESEVREAFSDGYEAAMHHENFDKAWKVFKNELK